MRYKREKSRSCLEHRSLVHLPFVYWFAGPLFYITISATRLMNHQASEPLNFKDETQPSRYRPGANRVNH